MKKWEYLFVDEFQSQEELDEIGDQGWELVNFFIFRAACNPDDYIENHYRYIFKRERENIVVP